MGYHGRVITIEDSSCRMRHELEDEQYLELDEFIFEDAPNTSETVEVGKHDICSNVPTNILRKDEELMDGNSDIQSVKAAT